MSCSLGTITINTEINSDELAALAVAVKMLDKGGVDVPTQEQLSDVALIVSGVNGSDYNEMKRFLESMISFQMEDGILID